MNVTELRSNLVAHPLDHKVLTPRCRRCFGGWRQHAITWWRYVGAAALRRGTLCRLGIHHTNSERGGANNNLCTACTWTH